MTAETFYTYASLEPYQVSMRANFWAWEIYVSADLVPKLLGLQREIGSDKSMILVGSESDGWYATILLRNFVALDPTTWIFIPLEISYFSRSFCDASNNIPETVRHWLVAAMLGDPKYTLYLEGVQLC